MEEWTNVWPVARMRSEFPAKFGIPRQSGLVPELKGRVVFEPAFRNPDALRGIEGFSHLWLIWAFSAAARKDWSPTVRPPRLGGNTRVGVFATRSPFRPNPLGLSCVKLEKVELDTPEGPVLWVSGGDLMDGTPIFDIKPYIPYADCHPDAREGFAPAPARRLTVEISAALREKVPEGHWRALEGVLACDPRPSYQEDPKRVYGMPFAGMEVRFRVEGTRLLVTEVEWAEQAK